jgi:hypothetical protein
MAADHDQALAEYRIKYFLADNTPSTPQFHPKTSEGDIIRIAKERMMRKLLGFNEAFVKSVGAYS